MAKNNKFNLNNIQYEWIFTVLALGFGLAMVFINPPFHGNDEDRHFTHAYHIKTGNIIPEVSGNMIGGYLPDNLASTVVKFQGIPYFKGSKLSRKQKDELSEVQLNPEKESFYHNFHYKVNPIPFIPYAASIGIGSVIDDRPVMLGYFARIGGLMTYIILMFTVIRLTPIYKSVFFIIGLTPMTLYQASIVTYDMMNNALSFLLIALFLFYALKKEGSLDVKDYFLIALIAIIHRFTKNGYVLIPFLFFIIPPKKAGSTIKMAVMGVFFILLYFLPNWTWGSIINSISSGIDVPELKKDFYVSFNESLSRNLSDPIGFIGTIFGNIMQFKKEWYSGVIGRFGYSYTLLPDFILILHGVVLIFAASVDSVKNFFLSNWQKLIFFLVGSGTIFLVIAGMLFASPLGANMIFGVQGRYFIPAIPMLLILLYNNQIQISEWAKRGILYITIYMILILIYTVSFMDEAFYGI